MLGKTATWYFCRKGNNSILNFNHDIFPFGESGRALFRMPKILAYLK